MVDLGGSLAVASRGLYATGVSTDLNGELGPIRKLVLSSSKLYIPNPISSHFRNVSISRLRDSLSDLLVTYLNSGGQIGDVLKAVVTCDKCEYHTREVQMA